MKFQDFFVLTLAASLFAAVPALAQPKPDDAKPDAETAVKQQPSAEGSYDGSAASSMGAQKQHTQAGAGFEPQQYGSDWAKNRRESSSNK